MYSERELIQRLGRQFGKGKAIQGIGDDAAILGTAAGFSTLFCSDLLVENTHFHPDTHPPHSIGFKAIAVNVSDIGAMGGFPLWCVLSLSVPPDTATTWIDQLLEGVAAACGDFGVELVGGDTARGERIFVDVAMLGQVEAGEAVRRTGARVGDGIYVTGSLGAAARGLDLLSGGVATGEAVERHLYPRPRHAIGRVVRGDATAMIDLSDGLATDLHHILESSGVSAEIEAGRIPCAPEATLEHALTGGEDYELLITGTDLPKQVRGVSLTRIGDIVPSTGTPSAWLKRGSETKCLDREGWQHFGETSG